MAISEFYTLKWKTYFEGITKEFRTLRNDSDFNDITLAFDDESFLETNRLIVSACSPVLRNIIKMNCKKMGHQPQMIYLSGYDSRIVSLLVDFMYLGEIKVSNRDIDTFLQSANRLQVQGLATPSTTEPSPPSIPAKESEPELQIMDYDSITNQSFEAVETTKDADTFISADQLFDDVQDIVQEDITEVDPKTEPVIENREVKQTSNEDLSGCYDGELGVYKCADCDKTFPKEKSLCSHRELFHDVGIMWKCKGGCDKTFRIKNTMLAHNWRLHRNNDTSTVEPKTPKREASDDLKCPQCSKVLPTEKQLATHLDYYHAKDGVVHNCGICESTFLTKNSMNVHRYQKHSKEEVKQYREEEREEKRKRKDQKNIKEESKDMPMEEKAIEEIDFF